MKKAILLLHGLKTNEKTDDFSEVIDIFDMNNCDIYNEVYFDLGDKRKLKSKYFRKREKEIADKLNGYDEIEIVAYSFGIFIASGIFDILKHKKITIYSIVPPIKVRIKIWITYLNKKRKLKKKMIKIRGKEYKKKIKEHQKLAKQNRQKNMTTLILTIWKETIFRRKKIKKIKDINYLFTSGDTIVKEEYVIKKLRKSYKYKSLEISKFDHYQITRNDKKIFIDWYKKLHSLEIADES